MILKGLIDEDFSNYKKASMILFFPYCSFKCDIECGSQVCQNSALASAKDINISTDRIIERYLNNNLTTAIVCSGLEPFDTYYSLMRLVCKIREVSNDDIIIYTGYDVEEILDEINELSKYPNIIVKFGRFSPDSIKRYDDLLGIWLASDNQYAERIS